MSKLDRFFTSENLLIKCPKISAITLDRFLFDHHPILLRGVSYDYGLTPFHFFQHWLELDGFTSFVTNQWNNALVDSSNGLRNLMGKLKFTKSHIKEWLKCNKQCNTGMIDKYKEDLGLIDSDIDSGKGSDMLVAKQTEILNDMQNMENLHAMDMAQKAKIKWSIKGDENSRFLFDHHPILLRGVSYDYGLTPFHFFQHWLELDGFTSFVTNQWNNALVDSSNGLRNLMGKLKFTKSHIKEWLKCNKQCNTGMIDKYKEDLGLIDSDIDSGKGSDMLVAKQTEILNDMQNMENLHAMDMAQKAKIKWSIKGDENSRFFHGFWATIEKDVFKAINHFFPHADIPKGCNSSFITLIPNIPDANLVKDFRPISLIGSIYKIIAKILTNRLIKVIGDIALIFKVDFEKAFDSVRWDFLDDVLRKFGFENKWCEWIQNCLMSSHGSILINGSPTEEFQFFKGLKQGDPLSSFLFILVMECLHIYFQKVVDAGMFTGISLNQLVILSHMFYADDAVFVGQWNDRNINTITHMLRLFFYASGLQINMSKSKIMGVHVNCDIVHHAAGKLGCLILNSPFSYLGTKVGGNMSRSEAWNEVIDKIRLKLGNGESASFWYDNWSGAGVVKDLFPRIFALENHKEVVDASMFTGISLNQSVILSHMFYADDAVFVGQWNDRNINTITHVLRCFFHASGLRINMSKSKIMGVHVNGDIVHHAAGKLGCLILNSPFSYLGTKVGGNMSRSEAWNEVVYKANSRLSRWKMNALFIGGRLTLLNIETTDHLFFHCPMAKQITRKIATWWELDHVENNTYVDW
nr:RNA-directed DNA polymerase, eukaryota [Tanacetum cinerariifolium]